MARRELLPSYLIRYHYSDHLGSASVITSAGGAILDESDYYPFGGELVIANSDPNQYKFTGKERDSESGLDYFIARHYSSSLGRFLTPDWDEKPTTVPYADFGNPQSLNLYTYVGNNPVLRFDASGHCWPMSDCVTTFQNAVDSATERVISASIDTGIPDLAAATTAVAGTARDAVNGTADAFNAGDAVGGCMDSCKSQEMADAVGQDLSRTAGLVDMAAGAVGTGQAIAGTLGRTPKVAVVDATPEPIPGVRKGNVPLSERDPKRFFTKSERKTLKQEAVGKCTDCGQPTQSVANKKGQRPPDNQGHAAHKVSHAKGGRTTLDNGAHKCRKCNLQRGDN